jgi:hypothetical protein
MFERLMIRAERLGRNRASERRDEVRSLLEAEVPGGVAVEEMDEGVTLVGRALKRRFARDPALRSLTGRLR